MNNSAPNWNFESDSCVTNQKKPIGPDQELVELLWQNGEVVLHSQIHRKLNGNSIDSRQIQKIDRLPLRTSVAYGNPSNLVREDETVSWIQYPQVAPLEQDFCSNFLSELPFCDESDKSIKQFEEGKFVKFGAYSAPHVAASLRTPNVKQSSPQEFSGNTMPDPRFQFPNLSQNNLDLSGSNVSQFSAPPKFASTSSDAKLGDEGTANLLKSETRECSVMTIGSSYCGSNQIPRDVDISRASSNGVWTTALSAEPEPYKDDVHRTIPHDGKRKLETLEPTVTSSSGGSGSSLGGTYCQSTEVQGQKRKGTDTEEFEEQSEATELKSASENKASKRTGSSRRNRAAEVHNLSERRRRDRINEKMRALQQLIPHSNKTDKASMLDEAIEYLKSLQLQLQVFWMGAGMTPMMFPGIQHYMSQMGMRLAAPFLPPIHNPMHSPRVPLDQPISVTQTPNQTVLCQTSVLGPFNYQNQMQNPALSEQYARYMSYHMMQNSSQPMNVFTYGTSQAAQHSQTMIAPSNSSGAATPDDAVNGKMGASNCNNSST